MCLANDNAGVKSHKWHSDLRCQQIGKLIFLGKISFVATSATKQPNQHRTVTRRKPEEQRALSIGQQRLWYLGQLTPNSPSYNAPFLCRLLGHFDPKAFERAIDVVMQRHEILRTAILMSNGSLVPLVLKKRRADLRIVDLCSLPEDEREAEAQRLVRQESARPFDFSRDSLFRAILFQISVDEYLFFHDAPHLVFEGRSVTVLYRELSALYNGFVAGETPELPELPFQYSDFAAWQRNFLQGERLESLMKYWREKLAGAPNINLPLDFSRPAIPTTRGARRFFTISQQLLSLANSFFAAAGTSSFRGFCAAFNVLLHCYSAQTDISLGSPFYPHCRGIEGLIGFFVNTVVLRTDLFGDPTFRQLIRRVDVVVHGAIAHSDLTFDKILDAVRPPRDLSRTPLFQVNFRAPNQPYPCLQFNGVTATPAQYLDNGTAKFDLALELESATGRACYFEYATDLFKEATIVQMETDLLHLLPALFARPDTNLSSVSAVTAIRERVCRTGKVLLEGNPC